MNKAITVELQFFLISIYWGAILLLAYDGFRILRRIVKHNSFFLALEDLIFWVVSSVLIFAMMYRENNGIIRGFSIMGMGIGMILYHSIFSETLVNCITKLINALLRPITLVIQWLNKLMRFILGQGKKLADFMMKRLKNSFKSVKITLKKKKLKKDSKREKRLAKIKLQKEKKQISKQLKKKLRSEQAEKKNSDKKKKENKKNKTKESVVK